MPPPYPPGTNSLPPGGTLIINQTPIIGGTDTYILYDNNGVVGIEPASSLGLTVGVTPISGGTAGYVLSDNGGTLEEVPASSLSFAFYVNGSTGSDTNTGLSPAAAWQTISKVNASTFSPGAAVLFAGGQTFSGAIVSPNAGTAAQPITFGSYGGGQATISSGTSNGFTSTNQAGIIVRDLTFTGTGTYSILFNNLLGVVLQNIQAINCNATGYSNTNVTILGAYDDVLFYGSSAATWEWIQGPNGSDAIAVPTLYPTKPNSLIAWDLCPNGTPTDLGYGVAWADLCNTDQIQFGANPVQAVHWATHSGHHFFGAAEYHAGAILPFVFGTFNGDTVVETTAFVINADATTTFFTALQLGSARDTGLSRASAGVVVVGNGALGDGSGVFRASQFQCFNAGYLAGPGVVYTFQNSSFAVDTALSRSGVATVAVGNGTPGDTSGSVSASGYIASGSPGISATITTAKLTPATGANGSMTFVNGILTAQTQAT